MAQTAAYGGNAVSRSYDYNIRSNITSIAGSQLTETLYYNNAPSGGTPRWGGGIAGVNFAANGIMGQTWKYTYDGAGRLTLALREDSCPGIPLYGQNRFTYDRNGNILSLTNKLGTDSLTVAAPRTGNRLAAATYDANGNETSCTAEGTLSIVYNRLNLPERIVLSGNDTVRYWYSAAGIKLRENTTDYSGSLVIKNGLLDKLLVPTGYVAANGNITSNGQYVYFVKDHLGSVRATVAQNGTVLERYWYGPYGDDVPAPGQTTVQTGTTDNPYRFSGKERTAADYDFGARRYLPFRVPRWTTMDPMAEKYFSISPYAYCAADPVNLVDINGMWVPDSFGNLTAEKGDDIYSLSKYLGETVETVSEMVKQQNYEFIVGSTFILDNVYTRSIKNSTGDLTTEKVLTLSYIEAEQQRSPADNYNCWTSALVGTQGREITSVDANEEAYTEAIGRSSLFDANLLLKYLPIDESKATFGKTIIRFAGENNVSLHGAVFYGKSSDGTIYVFTKNGWLAKPEITTLNSLINNSRLNYGNVKGIRPNHSGYYKYKR